MANGVTRQEWQRALVVLSATVVTAVVVAMLYWAQSVFVPLALAVFFTFVLSPVVAMLQRRGLGRVPAVVATVGAAVLACALVAWMLTQQMSSLTRTLPDKAETIKAKV